MKKLLLFLLAVCASSFYSFSQRINALTAEGKPSCVPFAAFNPKNNSDTQTGKGEMVFPAGTDLSDLKVTITASANASVVEPATLPTDWSSTVNGIKIQNSATAPKNPNDWAKYSITLKVIKPAALPLEIKTGKGNFDSDSWTTATLGWAAACMDSGHDLIRLGGSHRSFVVAFDSAPDSLYYTIKSLGEWDGSGNVFDVEGSEDGVTWTSIVQYNATNIMPPSSPAKQAKIKLTDPKFRYIRWIYTTRNGKNHKPQPGNFNVSIENILVTKVLSSSLNDVYKNKIGAYIADGQLRLKNSSEVAEVTLYNVAGKQLQVSASPRQTTSVAHLATGIYIIKMKLHNGAVVTDKLIKK